MCDAMREYMEEVMKKENTQIAINFLKNGVPVDLIAKSIPSLPRQFIVELSRQIQQSTN